ncbi:solute carrier family 35 member B1 homolog [Neocloeon triangulifer]|uniref:solute carrier family 35 member B1 homolog n=1 Tax=Neocloeon triangulifer TaxID=2078957 RepID=UPI00286F703E|nr:solute carrier family 35 member B1 homolog [Neocloeon triangulifer]
MDNSRLLFYALGIFVCYFYYGVVQERITRGKYVSSPDAEPEFFTYSLSLVLTTCFFNYLFAKVLLATVQKKQGDDSTKTIYYCSSALTYLLAMVCSTMALQWVSYPTQVVGKSCKPIPVMILGVLLGRKRYPLQKYLFVLLIVVGVALFIWKDHSKPRSEAVPDSWMGEILLVLSLTMDGLTGAIQERMRAEHQSKSGHMMLNMNFWSCAFLSVAVLMSGEIWDFIAFVGRHPDIIWQLSTFALANALGQFFIFLTVSEFGPLPCSIVTTTRKFFTVLGSVLFFGNTLLSRQWLGTLFVFAGLFLDSMYGKAPAAPQKPIK